MSAWIRVRRSKHALPLIIVAGGALLGQLLVLTRRPLIVPTADSASYLAVADQLLHHPSFGALFDPVRTPAYPLFLALTGLLRGHEPGNAIAFAQALLLALTAVEAYWLTYRLTESRWAAALAGIVVGTNMFLLDWERTIMSEALALWAVATAVLFFVEWLYQRAWMWAAGFAFASVVAVLARPSLLYLPFGLLLLLLASDPRRWIAIGVVTVGVITPILGYAVINDHRNPGAGMTAVSNLNLLGKVMEYGMQAEGTPSALRSEANALVRGGERNPYVLFFHDPPVLGQNWAAAGSFGRAIILRHPFEYAGKSLGDLTATWLVVPYTWAPIAYTFAPVRSDPWWSQAWMRWSLAAYDAYLLFPVVLVVLVAFWRRIPRQTAVAVLALVLTVGANLVTSAFLGYTDFARLRTPADPIMMVLLIAGTAIVWRVATAPTGNKKPAP